MNLSLFIARRYLFSKKTHNAINIISGISVCGVALATMAMVCTLSVFNGFQDLVAGLFTAFDPDIKITASHDRYFHGNDSTIQKVRNLPEVETSTLSLEENAMAQYKKRQAVVTIKGVEDNFQELTNIDSILYGYGKFMLCDEIADYGILGMQLISVLGSGVRPIEPIEIFVPKRNTSINVANPSASFKKDYLYSPGVVFAVNQEKYDGSYVLTSLDFAKRLFCYDTEVTSLELKLKSDVNVIATQQKIERMLGANYLVQNRFEQQADVFRIMKIEKLVSYIFLSFILLIASFNIIGSLSMLIIDKKGNVETLRGLGADNSLIKNIFFMEGILISCLGALAGIIIGLLLCFLQERFGLISLGNQGGFLVEAYPVCVQLKDIFLVFITVLVVGSLSVWYPVHYLCKFLLK